MKKFTLGFLAASIMYAISAYILFPIPPSGLHGAYNINSGFVWCSNTQSCLHEIGHAMDYRMGRISQTPAFINAVNDDLRIDSLYSTKMRWYLDWLNTSNFQVNKYSELYAEMYTWSSGYKDNMPLDLQRFYQWGNYTSWQVQP